MGDLARPMLAEVLAALTGLPVGAWEPWLAPYPSGSPATPRWEMLDRGPRGWLHLSTGRGIEVQGPSPSWTVTDTADAQECLVARGLLPEGWCGDVRRGWHDRQARDDGWGDWRDVVLPAPRTIPDLVAVASLGVPALLRAETLAREACATLREYGCPQRVPRCPRVRRWR